MSYAKKKWMDAQRAKKQNKQSGSLARAAGGTSTIEGVDNIPEQNQTSVVYDLLSEGPIEGLVDGTNSIYLEKTPVTSSDTTHQPVRVINAAFTASTGTVVDSDSGNLFSDLSTDDGRRYVRIPGGKKVRTGNGSSVGISGTEGSTIITADSSFFATDDLTEIDPASTTNTEIDPSIPRPYIRIAGAGANSNVDLVTPIIRFISATSVEIGQPLPRTIAHKTASIDKIATINTISDANTFTISNISQVGTASRDVSSVEVHVSSPQLSVEDVTYNYQNFQYAFFNGLPNQPYLPGYRGIGSSTIIDNPNRAIEQTAGIFASNDNNTNGGWHETKTPDATAQPVIITDASVSNPNDIDSIKLTFKSSTMIATKPSSGDEKPAEAELRIFFEYKKTGDGAFTRRQIFGPTQSELNARASNRKTRTWEHPHNSGKIRSITKSPFAESFVIDITQYKPLTNYQIRIERTNPSQGKNGNYEHNSPLTLDTVEHRFADKLSYPHAAYAALIFDAETFSKIPTRGYEIKGLKVKVPTNYFPKGEGGRTSGQYDRNVTTGADAGSYQKWDGNFRGDTDVFSAGNANYELVWTDNPAWIFYDLVTNKRYGIGKYIDASQIDKYELYKIARYCDELVSDGKGGTEPRFSANVYIKESADALKVLKDITQVFRGMLYWLDGEIQFSQNRYQQPVYTFSKANVIDKFKYTSTASEFRSNQVRVTWNDPESMYKKQVEIVEDTNNILETGKIVAKDVLAFGCTSRGQAHRFGKWTLFTEILENEVVSFQTSINAGFLKPGDVVLLQDADRDVISNSGRLSSSSSTTEVNLDRAVNLSSGNTFKLSVMYPEGGAYLTDTQATINNDPDNASNTANFSRGDLITHAKVDGTVVKITNSTQAQNAVDSSGNKIELVWNPNSRVETQTISTTGASVSQVTVSSEFTSPPSPDFMWAIREYDTDGTLVSGSAQQYVITEIKEEDTMTYGITAAKYEASKFDLVDRGYVLDVGVDTNKLPSYDELTPAPSTLSLNLVKSFNTGLNDETDNPGITNKIRINWGTVLNSDGTQYQHLSHFEIKHNIDSLKLNKFKRVTAPKDETTIAIPFDGAGTYIVQIQAVNVNGGKSSIVQRKIEVTAKALTTDGPIITKIPRKGRIDHHIQCSTSTLSVATKQYKVENSEGSVFINPSNGNTASYQQDFTGMSSGDEAYLLFDASESATSGDRLKAVKVVEDTTAVIPVGVDENSVAQTITPGFTYLAEVGASNNGITAATGTISGSEGDTIITGSSTTFTSDFENGDRIIIDGAGATRFYSTINYIESDSKLQISESLPRDYSGVSVNTLSFKGDPVSDVILAKVSYDGSTYSIDENYAEGTESLGYFHYENSSNTNALSADAFKTQFGRFPAEGDILIVVNTSTTPKQSKAYKFDSSPATNDFVEMANFITGDLVVDGTIEGDKIRSDTQIIAGADDSNKQAVLDGTGTGDNALRIYAGANVANKANAPFKVTQAGALTATNATITGGITASTGSIGGWTIDTTSIFSGTKDVTDYTTTGITISSDSGGSIHAKEFYIDTSGNANFKGTIFGGSVRADVTNPIPTDIFTRSSNQSIPTGSENGAFIDLNAGKFVFGDADRFIAFSGSELDVKAVLAPTVLDLTSTAATTLPSTIKASAVSDGSIGVGAFSQAVWNEIDSRVGTGTGGFYATATDNYLGEATKTISIATAPDHGTETVTLEVIINDSFGAPVSYSYGNPATAVDVTLQYKKTTDSTYTTAGSTQTFYANPTPLSYITVYTIDEAYSVDLTSGVGNDLENGTDYDFRVLLERAHSSLSVFLPYSSGGTNGANDSTGTPVVLEAREGSVGAGQGDLFTTEFLYHTGDADTHIQFQEDQIDIAVGGSNFATFQEGSQNTITLREDVIMSGNLTVQGTQTTLNTTLLDVEDKNITLNYSTSDSSASANGAGITIQDAVSQGNDATLTWNTTNDSFNFSHNLNFGDNVYAQFGASNDFKIYHDGSNVISASSGNIVIDQNTDDGFITLRADDGSGGIASYFQVDGLNSRNKFFKKAHFPDNVKAQFGDSDDLHIYHDASSSLIRNYTGALYIQNDQDDGNIIFRSDNGSGGIAEYIVINGGNGSTMLKHYGSTKLATTSTGIDITGTITADGLDLGDNSVLNVDTIALDKIKGDADDNTNITFAGSDTTTFTQGGSQVMSVNTTGLTINGTAQINGTSAGQLTLDATGQYNQITFEQNSGNNSGGDIVYDHTNDQLWLRSLAVGSVHLKTGTTAGNTVDRLKVASNGDISFYEDTGTTAKFFWDASAESLGIGTILPDGGLDIEKTVNTAWSSSLRANDFLQISNSSTTSGSYSGIELIATGTGSAGAAEIVCIDSGSGSGDLAFSTRNSGTWGEKVRLTASGRLLVGKTISNSATVGVEARGTGNLLASATSNFSGFFNRLSTDGTIVEFAKDDTPVGSIGTNSGYLYLGSTVGADAHILIGNNLIHPATSTGSGKDGVIVIGSPTNRFKDLYLSGEVEATALDINGNADISGNLTVGGDLNVGTADLIKEENDQLKIQSGQGVIINIDNNDSGPDLFSVTKGSSGATILQISTSGNSSTFSGPVQATSFSDGTISGITFVDEDNMVSNSATKVPTQQSVKAYVDANAGSGTTINNNANNRVITGSDTANTLEAEASLKFNDTSGYTDLKINGSSLGGVKPALILDDTGSGNYESTLILTAEPSASTFISKSGTTNGTFKFQGDNGTTITTYGGFDADGNFEIGTTDIIDDSRNMSNITTITADGDIASRTSAYPGGRLILDRTASSSGAMTSSEIHFRAYGNNTTLRTFGKIEGRSTGYTDGQIMFYTQNSGTLTETLTLDSSQNATFAGSISALGGNLTITEVTGADSYTKIAKTNTGSNLAVVSQESIYMMLDENNDQTNRGFFIKKNAGAPASGSLLFSVTESGAATFTGPVETGTLTIASGSHISFEAISADIIKWDGTYLNIGATEDDDHTTRLIGFGGSTEIILDDGQINVEGITKITNNKTSTGTAILQIKDDSSTDVMGQYISLLYDGSAGEAVGGVIGVQQPISNAPELFIANGSATANVGLALWSYIGTARIVPCGGTGVDRDDAVDLGASNARFDDIYATNGTIQTSDRNEKQDIQELSEAEQRVATACKGLIRRYKFNSAVEEKGDDARYHFGVIAQDLQDAFTTEGLDAGDYGMFISETWWEETVEGEVITYDIEDLAPEGAVQKTRLGVRYNELLAFIIASL